MIRNITAIVLSLSVRQNTVRFAEKSANLAHASAVYCIDDVGSGGGAFFRASTYPLAPSNDALPPPANGESDALVTPPMGKP